MFMMSKMQILPVFAMTIFFCFQAQLSAAYFGSWTLNGQDKLLGSSFGFPGANATFDYVVSLCRAIKTGIFPSCVPMCLSDTPIFL